MKKLTPCRLVLWLVLTVTLAATAPATPPPSTAAEPDTVQVLLEVVDEAESTS